MASVHNLLSEVTGPGERITGITNDGGFEAVNDCPSLALLRDIYRY